MNQFLDFIYNLIFHPKTAFTSSPREKEYRQGLSYGFLRLAVASMSSVVEGAGLQPD